MESPEVRRYEVSDGVFPELHQPNVIRWGDRVTEPMSKEKRAEVSEQEPVAWLVTEPKEFCPPQFLFGDEDRAKKFSKIQSDLIVVPLYRSPQATLTADEREALLSAAWDYEQNDDDLECAKMVSTLRSLVERLSK